MKKMKALYQPVRRNSSLSQVLVKEIYKARDPPRAALKLNQGMEIRKETIKALARRIQIHREITRDLQKVGFRKLGNKKIKISRNL